MVGGQLWGLEQNSGKNIRAGIKCGKEGTCWRENWEAELRGLLESETQSPYGLASASQTQPKANAQGPLRSLSFFVGGGNIENRNNLAKLAESSQQSNSVVASSCCL